MKCQTVWLAVLVLAGTAPSLAAGPAFTRPPRVVDSAGRVLGTYMDVNASSSTFNVLRREGGKALALEVVRDGISRYGEQAFLHETADCSGPRYLAGPTGNLLVSIVTVAFNAYYYPADPLQMRNIQSQEDPYCGVCSTPLPGGGCCCEGISRVVEVGAPATVDLSVYTPPFSVSR